jgi:Xaa-Pro aminopeptidase
VNPIELTPMGVASRAAAVRGSLVECDALLVTALPNVRWLTGFTGSAARVLVQRDDLVLVTDGRYGEQAEAQMAAAGVEGRVLVGLSQAAQREHLIAAVGTVARLGLEAEHVSWAAQQGYAEAFAATLVATTGLVEHHRLTKDAGELDRIETAARIADDALAEVLPLLDEEPAEAAFALALDSEMRRRGADGPSFDTIVAGGANAGFPHHRPAATRMRQGDLVIIDFGALVDGYHSDMTRTYCLGPPTADQVGMIEAVTEAQRLGVAAVAPGVDAKAVDAVCRDYLRGAGRGERFTHGTGHGVGLLIHEAPWLNATSTDCIEQGQVLTVEPGVYHGEFGGVRVEDTVLVTDDGCRTLTMTPKDPCRP